MDGFDLLTFNGISPRTSPRLLREAMATKAENAYLLHGNVGPIRLPLDQGISFPAGAKSIYRLCGEWLSYDRKTYYVHRYPADDAERLYVANKGMSAFVRSCDGKIFSLRIEKPSSGPTTTATPTDYSVYTFRFYGFYEGTDGTLYDKSLIAATEIEAGKEYTFVPFARVTAPTDAEFGVSMEVEKAGSLLGIAYSSNTYRAGNSDLYLNSYQVTTALYDRSTGTDTAYDDASANPTLMAVKLSYAATETSAVTRAYAYTYVTAWGEETGPSDGSDLIVIDAGNDVIVSGFAAPTHANVDRIRLYRSNTSGTFQYVDEFPVGTASYTDTKLDTELVELLPSKTWEPAPADLAALVEMPNNFLAGFAGNVLWFSETNQYHAFPVEYTSTKIDGNIVGISGAFENSLVVVTDKHPHIVTGYSPDAMTVTKVSAFEPCMSPESIVDMGIHGVGYASPNGFVVVRAGSAPVFTEGVITPEQWREYKPATMRCEWWQGRLHVVSDVVHLVFNMGAGDDMLTTESIRPTALWADMDEDALWIVDGGNMYKHYEGDYALMDWISSETTYQRPQSFARAKIEADGYPVTLKLFADGAEVYRRNVPDDKPFYLPVLPRSKHWLAGVESKVFINRLVVSSGHAVL